MRVSFFFSLSLSSTPLSDLQEPLRVDVNPNPNPLFVMERFQAFLDGCWRLGVPSNVMPSISEVTDADKIAGCLKTLVKLHLGAKEEQQQQQEEREATQMELEALRQENASLKAEIQSLRKDDSGEEELRRLRVQISYLQQQNAQLRAQQATLPRTMKAVKQEKRATGLFAPKGTAPPKGAKPLVVSFRTLLQGRPLDEKASKALNDLLLNECGRRIFVYALDEAQKNFQMELLAVPEESFFSILALLNSVLTGMELDRDTDLIAMDHVMRISSRVGRGEARPAQDEFLVDRLYRHAVWNLIRFWDNSALNQISTGFSKKFSGVSLVNTALSPEETEYIQSELLGFASLMVRWRRPVEDIRAFLRRNGDVLLVPDFKKAADAHIAKEQKKMQSRLRERRKTMTKDLNLLQGFLLKKGEKGVKRFKKRYFAQTGSDLHYFVNKEDATPQGTIDLRKIKEVTFVGKELRVLVSSGRIYVLMSPNEEDYSPLTDYWLPGFERAQARYAVEESSEDASPVKSPAQLRKFAEEYKG